MNTTRRNFLKLGATAMTGAALLPLTPPIAAAAAAQPSPQPAAQASGDPYGGLLMGIQSYSLRDRSFDKMLEAMAVDLKLGAVEIFPNHLAAISPAQATEKLAAHRVKAISYGVIGFGKDEAKNRAHFDLAKALGLSNLSCDPDDNDETFQNLEKLTEEFGITVAIHPHGPGHKWGKRDQLDRAFKGRSTRIGICADTGHLIRAGEDPLATCKAYQDRLHALHLKDFKKLEGNDKWLDVPAGDATLDVDGIIAYLLQQQFKGGVFIEYEGKEPVKSIQASLARVQTAVQEAKH